MAENGLSSEASVDIILPMYSAAYDEELAKKIASKVVMPGVFAPEPPLGPVDTDPTDEWVLVSHVTR